jgi:hypothetical protein
MVRLTVWLILERVGAAYITHQAGKLEVVNVLVERGANIDVMAATRYHQR